MRPKTQEEKEMQGTFEPSKEGLPPVELEVWDGQSLPPAPDGWPPRIMRIWNDRCRDLKKSGYLTRAFLVPLQRYCFAIYQAEKAEAMLMQDGFISTEIGTKGQTYEVPSKWLSVLDQANKVIEKLGSKFGFTPLDVQKIPAIVKKVNEDGLLK